MEESGFASAELSVEQYKMYVGLLRQTSLQRAISNYFFIAVNVVIMLTGYIFVPRMAIHISLFVTLSVIGIILSLYWFHELRESYVINVVRYRTVIELESRLFDKGIFNEEWNRLGDYKFRRSPVFFVSLGRILPFLFVIGHIVNLGLLTLL